MEGEVREPGKGGDKRGDIRVVNDAR
jgi:hypothetical protein